MGSHYSRGFLASLWLTRESTYSTLPSHMSHSSVSNRLSHPHGKLCLPQTQFLIFRPDSVPVNSYSLSAMAKAAVASQCQCFPSAPITQLWATRPAKQKTKQNKKLHFQVCLAAWCSHVTNFWLMRGKQRVTGDFWVASSKGWETYTLFVLLSFLLSFWNSDVMGGTPVAILGQEENLKLTEQKDIRILVTMELLHQPRGLWTFM